MMSPLHTQQPGCPICAEEGYLVGCWGIDEFMAEMRRLPLEMRPIWEAVKALPPDYRDPVEKEPWTGHGNTKAERAAYWDKKLGRK